MFSMGLRSRDIGGQSMTSIPASPENLRVDLETCGGRVVLLHNKLIRVQSGHGGHQEVLKYLLVRLRVHSAPDGSDCSRAPGTDAAPDHEGRRIFCRPFC